MHCIRDGASLSEDTGICPRCAKEIQLDGYNVIRAISAGKSPALWVEYLGFDTVYHRLVVIRSIGREMLPSPDRWEEFEKRELVQGKLQHPCITRIYRYIFEGKLCHSIMEYTEGRSGIAIIEKTGPVPNSRALPIFLQIAKALEYSHSQKIYHGLVGPALITVSDAGAAKITGFDDIRFEGYANGQTRPPDLHADITLFGKTMYEFLTGCRISSSAMPAESMTDYYPHISPRLEGLTMKLIEAEKPEATSMNEIRRELNRIAQEVAL